MVAQRRVETVLLAVERDQVEAFVDEARDQLVALVDGLTEEQARRSVVPSLTTLLGLVKHGVFVERVWFPVAFEGRARADLGIPEQIDDSFRLADADTIQSVVSEYLRAAAHSREIAACHDLDDRARHNRRGPLSLRWVYLHLVEELARHAGHGDILREQILAADARMHLAPLIMENRAVPGRVPHESP